MFGSKDPAAAAEAAAVLGLETDDVRLLGADEQIIRRHGECLRIHSLDYTSDPLFAGLLE